MLFSQTNEQTVAVSDTFRIRLDNQYQLGAISMLPGSESLILRGCTLTKSSYNISYANGIIQLKPDLTYSVFDTLIVHYRTYRISFPKEYYHRRLVFQPFQAGRDSTHALTLQASDLSSESIFGKNIEKSGTLIRGFTVGTNRDLTVQSGFRLQISGKLSDDIELVAALTDENSPIQPEGTSERLDELDKVFIQVKHPNATGTFGEYDFTKKLGEFGVINRKLQGLSAEANWEGYSGFVAFATSRGKFTTNSLSGQDAVQGPYLLSGRNNEKDIIIIAGSEKVYLNGELLRRGEQNDFTIDYANAQITFTPKKLITSASRIFVEFEYTDRKFTRNFFGTGVAVSIPESRIKMSFQYFREGDDPDAPIDATLTAEDKKILQQAGGNRLAAVRSGVTLATPDSLQVRRGYYTAIDSISAGTILRYYKYAPGSADAIYNISFSYVGEGKGNYTRDLPGQFSYVGSHLGGYDTIVFLPMPELRQFSSLCFTYTQPESFILDLEGGISSLAINRLSGLEDAQHKGYGINFSFRVPLRDLSILKNNFGKIGLGWKERVIQSTFDPLDRLGSVEFSRDYNLPANAAPQDEHLREISLQYQPIKSLEFSSLYGHIQRGSEFSTSRYHEDIAFKQDSGFAGTYSIDYVVTQNGQMDSKWLKQQSTVKYRAKTLTPALSFQHEDKQDKNTTLDSLYSSSLKYYQMDPVLTWQPWQAVSISGGYTYREDFAAPNGELIPQAESFGYNINSDIRSSSVFQTSFSFSAVSKEFKPFYRNKGELDSKVILVKNQTRYNPLRQLQTELFYTVSTQKTAKLERVFVQVAKGFGNYRYVGDLNKNGIKDDNEFEPAIYDGDYQIIMVPTDKLYPVIDLKTSARIRWNLQQIITGAGLFTDAINALTFETYLRLEENSTDDVLEHIYLLNTKFFRNEKNTIRGTQSFQQTINIFENKPDLNFRLFYSQTDFLNQYGSGLETGGKKEQSLRIKFQMMEEISNQTDIVHEQDNLFARDNAIRCRNIDGTSLTMDFSYHPVSWIETGFKIKTAKSTDNFPAVPTVLTENGQQFRTIFQFTGKGRLRLEAERIELSINNTKNYIPFELTGGNGIGLNNFFRAFFDYRLADNLQASANYEGRSISGSRLIHTARAEMRAFF
ncbi:MAG: hypothetical protein LWX56_09535 [Ignavibacteria bacterium]|nr:hypothetical protein [Ignavibacteria bacterium]